MVGTKKSAGRGLGGKPGGQVAGPVPVVEMMPAAVAAFVKLSRRSMVGRATGLKPNEVSAARMNLTCASSSAAISMAYCRMASVANGTTVDPDLTMTLPGHRCR